MDNKKAIKLMQSLQDQIKSENPQGWCVMRENDIIEAIEFIDYVINKAGEKQLNLAARI